MSGKIARTIFCSTPTNTICQSFVPIREAQVAAKESKFGIGVVHFHLNFTSRKGLYEHISKRPLFYEVNAIHRNSLHGWKWASDVFAILLILITLTGLFILKGKHGLGGRGKWLLAAGFAPILLFVVLLSFK